MSRAAIFGLSGLTLTAAEAAFLRDADPFGIILFRRNIETADQTRALTAGLRDLLGRDLPVFVDQEGGPVQRLRPPLARDWPAAADQRGGPRAIYLRHVLMAAELRALGIDANCAPVIDLRTPDTHPFLRARIWGDRVETVIAAARAAADGLLAGGVLPVIKHLPGHGRAGADSHHDLPRVSTPRGTLDRTDFAILRALADLPMGMSAHVVFDALDPDAPATISAPAVGAIRAMGFGGLLMTDDICMKALAGDVAQRARAALGAGCDVVLHCSGDLAEMQAVAAVCPVLDPATRSRALDGRAPPPVDIAALEAEFGHLSA
jgi:beta-N-acetylhexosaminidase